jgi:hypothetical protein
MPGMLIVTMNGDVVDTPMIVTPRLDVLQKAVGGYIEEIPLWPMVEINGRMVDCVAFANEDGRMLKLGVNEVASNMWRKVHPSSYVLLGDVAIVYGHKNFLKGL